MVYVFEAACAWVPQRGIAPSCTPLMLVQFIQQLWDTPCEKLTRPA